ncbi:MAG: hypothetical protein R3Y28_04535 [Candidatus Gastranaerophilales bacterium]
MKYKKTILIDLDGVLNQYTGRFDKDFIPPIKDGAREFITKLSEKYEIKLFTTRNSEKAYNWLNENNLNDIIKEVTYTKDLCWLIVDDRCLRFTGDYETFLDEIENFKPWYK